MRDMGLSPAYVAFAMSFNSVSLAIFKFLTGIIYDKWGLRVTTSICSVTASVVMLLLACVTNSPTGMAIAMIYSIFSSLALPLETIMLPIYANEFSSPNSFNKILGIFVSVNTAGYAVGAPVANLCYDIFGSYNILLYISCILVIFTAVIMRIAINAAHIETSNSL